MNEIKDFILNFPFYVKRGVKVLWLSFKNSMVRLSIKAKQIELKGKEMQEKGKDMWLEAKEERERNNQK